MADQIGPFLMTLGDLQSHWPMHCNPLKMRFYFKWLWASRNTDPVVQVWCTRYDGNVIANELAKRNETNEVQNAVEVSVQDCLCESLFQINNTYYCHNLIHACRIFHWTKKLIVTDSPNCKIGGEECPHHDVEGYACAFACTLWKLHVGPGRLQ